MAISGTRGLVSRFTAGTNEQQELFKFIKGLLTSTNGWSRPNKDTILYLVTTGSKPEVKIGTRVESIVVGTECVTSNGRLTKGQVKKLTKMARSVGDELDAQARAGDINRLLAVLR